MACRDAAAPRSMADRSFNEPPNEPKPVRTPDRKTTIVKTPLRDSGEYSRGHFLGRGLPADIGRPGTAGDGGADGAFQVAGRLGMTELFQHQGAGQDGRDRIRDAFAGQRRRRAVHRLEQPAALARMQIRAGGDSQAAHQARAKIGEDVAVEIVGHDDLEAPRVAHQFQCERVDIAMLRFNAAILGSDRLELLLPDPVRRDRVGLVAHRDALFSVRFGPFERRANDAFDALRRIHFFRDVLVPARAAAARVLAFGIFAEDDEVDGRIGGWAVRRVEAKRRKIRMQQLNWPKVYVKIKPKSQTQQNIPRMLVPRNAGIPEGPEQYCVDVVPQMSKRNVGQCLAGPEKMIGRVRKPFPVQREPMLRGRSIDDWDRRFNDLRPNPVAGDSSNVMGLHEPPNRLTAQPPIIRIPSLARMPDSTPSPRRPSRRSPGT